MSGLVYPAGLPCVLRDGYGFSPTNNITRTEMQTGRARQRIEFDNVPTFTDVNWICTEPQAQLLESWAALAVGAGWFEIPLRTPNGPAEVKTCRFIKSVEGPFLLGLGLWRYNSRVEVRDRELLDADWPIAAPEFVLESALFDITMNKTWPLDKFQVHILEVDEALNQEWPQP